MKKTVAATGAAALTGAAAASVAASRGESADEPDPTPEPVRTFPSVGAASAAAAETAKPAPASYDDVDDGHSAAIWWMMAAIAVLFLLAWMWRSLQAQQTTLPAVANAVFQTCPAGTIPANLLADDLLSHGQIIVDE